MRLSCLLSKISGRRVWVKFSGNGVGKQSLIVVAAKIVDL